MITSLAGVVVALRWLGVALALDLTFQGVAAIAFGLALKGSR